MKVLWELFSAFFAIGAMTFGGGYAMLPMLEREIVQKHKWATQEEILNYFAIGQCTPGIIAVNTATFVGYKYLGVWGGIACTIGFILPSLIIILSIAAVLSNFAELAVVKNAFAGIRVCVCVLILNAVCKLWKKAVVDKATLLIFLAVFLCAASLLGAVASGFGLLAMTELGLREQTLEEAREESLRSTANNLANELVLRYASRELGGADESLIDQYYGRYWLDSTFDWDQVGYVIRDEEGNVLQTSPSEFVVNPSVYEIVATGSQYFHVLNQMTQEEYEEIYNPVTEPPMTMPPEVDVDSHVYNVVPEDGCDIGGMLVRHRPESFIRTCDHYYLA